MTNDEDRELTDEELEEMDTTITIRAKWAMDGAKTLSEAAQMLREYADELERKEKQGWQLNQPIAEDYGIVDAPSHIINAAGAQMAWNE